MIVLNLDLYFFNCYKIGVNKSKNKARGNQLNTFRSDEVQFALEVFS